MIKVKYFFTNIHKTLAYQKLVDTQKRQIQMAKEYFNILKESDSSKDAEELQHKTIKELNKIKQQNEQIRKEIKQEQDENFEKHLMDMEVEKEDIQLLKKNKKKVAEDIIINNINEKQKENDEINKNKINVPQKMEIRNLQSPLRMNGQLIILGVNRHSAHHAQYVYDVLFNLKPQVILSDIPVDDPFFIKTEGNYLNTWKQFITKGDDATFLINPNPSTLSDIYLHQNKIDWLMNNNIKKNNKMIVNPTNISDLINPFQEEDIEIIDILKTPFLYCFHHKTPLIINGYPELNYRYNICQNTTIETLKQLYEQKIKARESKQTNFDPSLLKPELFIKPQIEFNVEIMKLTIKSFSKSIMITESSKVNQLEEDWQRIQHNIVSQDLRKSIKKQDKIKDQQDFLKKLVILDEILSPFIYNNFIQFNCFPYELEDKPYKIGLQQMWEAFQTQFNK